MADNVEEKTVAAVTETSVEETKEKTVAAETETSVEEPLSLLEKKIIRQVEYYFGDVNYPRDKFLQEKKTEEDGWISLECLTTFNRLKCLSTDLEAITSALKRSKSGVLEINDTEFKVRRCPDRVIPDRDDPIIKAASKKKTLYMKGFPETYTIDTVQDFFTEKDINTIFIKVKTDDDRKFKGSIFVETSTQEEADKLLKSEELKCEENIITVLTRDDHFKEKDAEKRNNGEKESEEDPKFLHKTGCVIQFKGCGDSTSREDLKDLFGAHAPIAWVDFNRGETQGFIRFAEDDSAQKVMDSLKEKNGDEKFMINDVESELTVVEGEEEENYWKMVAEDMKKQRQRRAGGGRGRGRGRRGRGDGRRGRGDKNFKRKREWEDRSVDSNTEKTFKNDVTEAKKAKVEE